MGCFPTSHNLPTLPDDRPCDLNISGGLSGDNDVYKPIVMLFDNPAFSVMDYTSAATHTWEHEKLKKFVTYLIICFHLHAHH